jgi:O-succinylbenzoic acid--CoA ligase
MSADSDLIAWADRDPGGVFLMTLDSSHSFGQVADLIAARALALGDRIGEQVVVRPHLDVESIVELLAIARVGATAVVIPPDVPEGMATELIGRAQADARPCHSILFTSGSAGDPKGVRFSATNWEAAARASILTLGHGQGDRWLCPLPLYHVGGLSVVMRSLHAGGTVVLSPEQDDLAAWLNLVQYASMVPTQLRRVLQHRTDRYENLPRVLIGGGPVAPGLLVQAAAGGLEVLPTYGMTETTSQAATARAGDAAHRLFPVSGVEIAIGPGDRIRVRGETVALSYLGEPDRQPGDWYDTSDRGRIERDGSLVVLGRLDRVIITGAENIDPDAVETVLGAVPGVLEVAVLGIPDPDWGEVVAAAYCGSVRHEDLESTVRDKLGPKAVPKRWVRVDRMPRTALGKVDRSVLAVLFGEDQAGRR